MTPPAGGPASKFDHCSEPRLRMQGPGFRNEEGCVWIWGSLVSLWELTSSGLDPAQVWASPCVIAWLPSTHVGSRCCPPISRDHVPQRRSAASAEESSCLPSMRVQYIYLGRAPQPVGWPGGARPAVLKLRSALHKTSGRILPGHIRPHIPGMADALGWPFLVPHVPSPAGLGRCCMWLAWCGAPNASFGQTLWATIFFFPEFVSHH